MSESSDAGGGRRFLSVAEAAELLGVSAVTVHRAVTAGDFPAVKIRGRYVIPMRAIDALEESAVEEWRARRTARARRTSGD